MAHGIMNKNEDGHMRGTVCMRAINEKFRLEVNTDKRGVKPPSHIIIGKAPLGHAYQAGLAYEYDINKGDMTGRIGFNLCFNDPDLGASSLWFSAYPNATMGWDLSFKREEKTQQEAA
ncbi:MAG: hypothetical protein JKY93_03195 [Gammaproteobacteria bacterium]|nr:hypothetical protein [Gammaproteobacteria bacterium]